MQVSYIIDFQSLKNPCFLLNLSLEDKIVKAKKSVITHKMCKTQSVITNKLVCYHCQPWNESILYALTQAFAFLLEKRKKNNCKSAKA